MALLPDEYDEALAARPDLIERLRDGDTGALVDIFEQVFGMIIESHKITTVA